MSIKSRLQRLERSVSPSDESKQTEIRHRLDLAARIRADPVAMEAVYALEIAPGLPGGFQEYRERWTHALPHREYPPEVTAALESDDPRAALEAILTERVPAAGFPV